MVMIRKRILMPQNLTKKDLKKDPKIAKKAPKIAKKAPKNCKKSPKKAPKSQKRPKIKKKTKKPEKAPKKPKKAQKKPKKARNFKIAEKAQKSPNFFGSFSSGLFKMNFGVHGHFFY